MPIIGLNSNKTRLWLRVVSPAEKILADEI